MKWNWGTEIVVGLISFMSFILFMVITMSTDQRYGHDLITDKYYPKEMYYLKKIDAETNRKYLLGELTSYKTLEGWQMIFPSQLDPLKINGTVFFYRPSNQKLDF